MGDWEDVFGASVSLDDLEAEGFFKHSEKDENLFDIDTKELKQRKKELEKIFEQSQKNKLLKKKIKKVMTRIEKNKLVDIVKRIREQSYSYSYRNSYGKNGKVSSIFIEYDKNITYFYIPIFNWFEQEIIWIKVDSSKPIYISQKYSYFKHPQFSITDMEEKLELGLIKNFTFSKDNIEKTNLNKLSETALYILDEVLYTKGIFIVICFQVYDRREWVNIPIEGALSGRGKETLRTDEHGNHFSKSVFDETKRYKIYQIKLFRDTKE